MSRAPQRLGRAVLVLVAALVMVGYVTLTSSPLSAAALRISPATVSTIRLSPAALRSAELAAARDTAVRVTPAQVTPAQVTPAQVTPAKVTPAKVTPAQVTPSGASAPTTYQYGCAAAIAYLSGHAAPGFRIVCPGYAEGHEAMTCENAGPCPGQKVIVIADPCPAAYRNEASNSRVFAGLSEAPIDPFGAC